MEHLLPDAREPISAEAKLPPSSELSSLIKTERDLAHRALLLNVSESYEPMSVIDVPVKTGENTNNQEGDQNAELFKRKYDDVVELIDSALRADVDDLDGTILAILSSIDALHATPYISSAPEFVAMVKAGRNSIEAADSFIGLGGQDAEFVANALSLAKQEISGTLIAYRPRR